MGEIRIYDETNGRDPCLFVSKFVPERGDFVTTRWFYRVILRSDQVARDAMQRLRENNSGAALPLGENELLSASTTQTLPSGSWCHVRMRLAMNGEAERSVHLYATAAHPAFHHEQIVVPAAVVAELSAAVRAAFAERESLPDQDGDDSQALYRTIRFREGGARPKGLAVEYQYDKAMGPAAAFEAAWRLLAGQFPRTRPGQEVIPGLRW